MSKEDTYYSYKIHIEEEELREGKAKSSSDSSIPSYKRYAFTSNKLMSLEMITKYLSRYLNNLHDDFHKINNKSIEVDFSTIKNGDKKNFGRTGWIPIDQSLDKKEWKKAISDIDFNKTLSLYEGEKKIFEENIKRNTFWLSFRFRDRIGYNTEGGLGYCFFEALEKANIISVKKHRKNINHDIVIKYDENLEDAYDDVIQHINDYNKFKKEKDKIKLYPNGGIDFNDIAKLENFFKCNIIVNERKEFAFKHPGAGKYSRTIYLIFDDEKKHYELDTKHKPEFYFFDKDRLYNKEKLDILVRGDDIFYDGKKIYKNIKEEEIAKLHKNKHIVTLKKLKKIYKGETDIVVLHDLYKKDCEELEKHRINLLNSYSMQKAIFQTLYLDNRFSNIKTERITDYAEYEILNYRRQGGYNHVREFNKVFENVYSYDVKSSYPSILAHPDFRIPIKQGEFLYIEPEKFKKYIEITKDKNGMEKMNLCYGLFKCKISKPAKSDNFDEFVFSEYNVYTHFDILLAQKLGYEVELLNENIYPFLIKDLEKPFNAFVYKADKLINSNIIFGNIVKKFYEVKQKCKKNIIIKILSSGLWGNVCDDKTYKTKEIKKVNNSYDLELKDNEFVYQILPSIKDEKNIISCAYKESNDLTRTSLFRMKPFILSYQRYIMYIEFIKKIEDVGGKILKIKVDGVYTDKKIDEFEKIKEVNIDGDIVRDKYFDIILFKNKTFNLTTKEDIEEYLKSKPKKK